MIEGNSLTAGVGAEVNYTCNSNFTLVGDERRVCQANGLWTGVDPTCVGRYILSAYL